VSEEQELTDRDWRTLCDTLRGSIAMFDMLLAECANSSETARVVGDARRRREKVLERSRGACDADRGDLISRWFGREGLRGSVPAPATEPARKRRLVDASRGTVPTAFNSNPLGLGFLVITASARARPTSVTSPSRTTRGLCFGGPESQGGTNEFRND
jgi:hypothetical protein